MANQIQDDGFHEIQLNGKQLVFLFMAATVVSVVIFLCGVLVGRGVRAERAADSSIAANADPTGFVEALRMELEHEGLPISVTEIMPATINTPLFDKSRTRLGVKPKGLPPIYPASLVAEAILHAVRETNST